MADFSYVVDSSFKPFTLQEMLVPFMAYKDAYEKVEAAYDSLADSETFQYLKNTLPEGSKARQIYEGYAKDLQEKAEDLAHNGLNASNRGALSSLKRRYKGEIGRLTKADEALNEQKKFRQALGAKDPSMLYAYDNLSIDDFLDGNTPNLYSISGNDLYTRGAQAAKSASSRVFNVDGTQKTLGGYYLDFAQSVGYDAALMKSFREDMSAIPELAATADAILEEKGVLQNLTGVNLQRARQSVINGMIDGAVYTESHNPQRDLGVMTAAEEAQDLRAKQAQAITMWQNGAKWDDNGNVVGDKDNINYKIKEVEATTNQAKLDVMFPIGEDGKRHLNPDYKINSNLSISENTDEDEKDSKGLNKSLLKLKTKDLAHNTGFDVETNGDRKHYNYIGAVTYQSGGKWLHGALGEDVPGRGWGFTSSSNVMNAWGNYSAEGSDDTMRVLAPSEVQALMKEAPGAVAAINAQIEEAIKAGANFTDIQIIEVPNEADSKMKGYLIAVN